MSRREEFLKENMVDNLDAYGNKIGRCLTEIYFEEYDKAVISDYKESLVGKDVNEYLNSCIQGDGANEVVSLAEALFAVQLCEERYEKQLEELKKEVLECKNCRKISGSSVSYFNGIANRNLGNLDKKLFSIDEARTYAEKRVSEVMEDMISKEDAKRALCKSLGCNTVHSCDKCAAVQKFLNQLNK